MANSASKAATSDPARAPHSSPSHSDPVTDVAIAAQNAPSSSCPSMAMLMTPDVEQITPVSAPSMIGMESSREPDIRFTTLNPIDCPASDQAISAMTNRNSTKPTTTRSAARPNDKSPKTDKSRKKARSKETAPQKYAVPAPGSTRFGTVTLANSGVNPNVADPCACSPKTRMSTRPNTANAIGAANRPPQDAADPAPGPPGSSTGSRVAEDAVGTGDEVTRSTPWTSPFRPRRPAPLGA